MYKKYRSNPCKPPPADEDGWFQQEYYYFLSMGVNIKLQIKI